MKHDLYTTVRPGSPRARREKLKEALPLLEQALHNGWRWAEIVELARDMLGEPKLSVGALKNIRYRYKRWLAQHPEWASAAVPAPVSMVPTAAPAPVAPAAGAHSGPPPSPVQGESIVARIRRLQEQEKARAAQEAQAAQAGEAAAAGGVAASPSLGKAQAPRTVARTLEEIEPALRKDSDMLRYPVMSEEQAQALAARLEAEHNLRPRIREFAQYCFERIFPIYENARRPLIGMRMDAERWMPAVLRFIRSRPPYGAIVLAAVKQISPLPDLTEHSGPFERFLASQIRTVILEKVKEEDAAKNKSQV